MLFLKGEIRSVSWFEQDVPVSEGCIALALWSSFLKNPQGEENGFAVINGIVTTILPSLKVAGHDVVVTASVLHRVGLRM